MALTTPATCRTLAATAVLVTSSAAMASTGSTSSTLGAWFDTASEHVSDTWHEGDTELYVPFWTYHHRGTYDDDHIEDFNEFPAGIGLGKGRYNSSGNWEGMYAMGFMDSHNKPSFMAGYAWVPTWELGNDVKAGVGVTGFLMSRSNYWNGIPFPGVLPIASIGYKQLSLQAAYIPSTGRNNGNVLFMWGKWTFQ